MSGLSGYIMRLISAAILCALVSTIEGSSQGIRRLITGIFLTLTALSPIGDLELPDFDPERIYADAQAVVRSGTAQADEMRFDIISEAYTAYIWNKAAAMELEPEISLEVDDEGMLRSVKLRGLASPLERQRLTDAIVEDLGVGKGDVTWIDPYQSSE